MKHLLIAVVLLIFFVPATVGADEAPATRPIAPRGSLQGQDSGPVLGDLSFGINPCLGLGFPSQNVDNYSVFPQCGMGLVRLVVHWRDRQPARGEFYWGGLDNKVRVLQDLGIDVCFTLQSDAEWGIEPSEFPAANHPPTDMADWTEFLTHLVERYNGDGLDDLPGLLRPVSCYQVASEWPSKNNLHGGWTGTIDQLIEFFNASYDAIKAADPSTAVILGGIASISLDAMVLNAGQGGYVARQSYNETVKDSLTVEIAQDPRITEAVADKERVLAESRYDMVDLHMYGPVEYNQYRIARIRQSVGPVPLVSTECGGPNLAYDPDITPEEHFMTALDMNLDGLSRGLIFMMWLSMFGQEYVPGVGPTWGNSQLQLIDKDQQPTGGFWAYHLLAALLEGMSSVEKPGPGIYIIHRYEQPDIHVAWRTADNATYQLPTSIHPEAMMVVTDAANGLYVITRPPVDGLLHLGALPFVVSEVLPGDAWPPGSSFPSGGDNRDLLPHMVFNEAGNFPNPFNPATEIRFMLGMDSHIRIEVFDLPGRRIATLLDTDLQAGQHRVMWDATGQSSGTYIFRLTGAGERVVLRGQLVK